MKNSIKSHSRLIEVGIFIGLVSLLLTYLSAYYWLQDGLGPIEAALLSIIAGFFFLVITVLANGIWLNDYIKSLNKEGKKPIKRIFQVLIVFLVSIAAFTLLDIIIFQFDSSISMAYASALADLASANKQSLAGLNKFAHWPFSLQNAVFTYALALISSFISLLFIKKDGYLFKSQVSWR